MHIRYFITHVIKTRCLSCSVSLLPLLYFVFLHTVPFGNAQDIPVSMGVVERNHKGTSAKTAYVIQYDSKNTTANGMCAKLARFLYHKTLAGKSCVFAYYTKVNHSFNHALPEKNILSILMTTIFSIPIKSTPIERRSLTKQALSSESRMKCL